MSKLGSSPRSPKRWMPHLSAQPASLGAYFIIGFPSTGWRWLSSWAVRSLLGRPSSQDQTTQAMLAAFQRNLRRAIADYLMTIQLPPDRLISLGTDLSAEYPTHLQRLIDPDLCELIARFNSTVDSPAASGAEDWAALSDRMRFIAELFRCYQ